MDNQLIVIRQLPIIEEQLRQVKAGIEARVSEALSLACTEETYKEVKKARAELNKEYAELEQRRKEVKAAILTPYQEFEALYKECAGDIYSAADAQLKARIAEVETGLRQERLDEVLIYFEEYRQQLGISEDLVSFTRSGIKITLSESRKALRLKAKCFLDHIAGDLALIETQEHKDEILVEYHRTLNASQAITAVSNRHKAMEEERRRREATAAAQAARAEAQAKVEAAVAEDAPAPAPVPAPAAVQPPVAAAAEPDGPTARPADEELYATTFRVIGTKARLKALKVFLNEGGYQYEKL